MKTLILVRHAKSSWADAGTDDFDRPLNDRGKADAPLMAKRLQERLSAVDLFVASPARRALKTAKLFAKVFEVDKEDVLQDQSLYLAPASAYFKAAAGLSDDKNTVALFGHNPGITEAANMLCGVKIDDMPTCSLFAVAAAIDKWADFMAAPKQFLFFDYPKNPLG